MKKIALLSLMSFFAVTLAQAASNGGGSDGCGLGWQVTDKKTMIATTTRGTTNAFVPPTFGMTSGTIGCDQHAFAMRDLPASQLVATHFDALMMDMAKGEGESLAALAAAVDCQDVAAFGSMTKREFSNLSKSTNAPEMVRQLRQLGCGV